MKRLDTPEARRNREACTQDMCRYADTAKLTALFTGLQPLVVRAAENEVAEMGAEDSLCAKLADVEEQDAGQPLTGYPRRGPQDFARDRGELEQR